MTLSLIAPVSKGNSSPIGRKSNENVRLGRSLSLAVMGGASACSEFEARLSPAALEEWRALGSETEAGPYFDQLISFAQRLQLKQPKEAAQVFASTHEFLSQTTSDFQEQNRKAKAHFLGLTGQGDLGHRAEALLSKLAQEASDPAALVAMGLGTQAFRWGRLWTAGRLGQSGYLAQAAATTLGFFAETTTFTLGHKGAAALLGRPQEWNLSTLGREWAGGAMMLGPLKAMGSLGGVALGRYMAMGKLPQMAMDAGFHSIIVAALPQVTAFAGLLMAQELQGRFGLRQSQGHGADMTEALATLLQLHVGGKIASAAFGAGYRQSLMEADFAYAQWRSRDSGNSQTHGPFFFGHDLKEAASLSFNRLATAYGLKPQEPLKGPTVLMMAADHPGQNAKHQWTMEDFKRLGEFRASLNAIEADALSTVHPDRRHMMLFSRLVQNISFSDRETRTVAISKLGHAMRHARNDGDAGSYVNWLTRRSIDSYLETQDLQQARALLQFLVEGGSLANFEKLIANGGGAGRLAFLAPWVTASKRSQFPYYDTIQRLSVSEDAKRVLFRWHYTQARSKNPHPDFLPEEAFLNRIAEAIAEPQLSDLVSKAIVASERSPVPFLRLQRLYNLLGDTDALTPSKLYELSDTRFQLVGRGAPKLPVPFLGKSRPSQFNGYLGNQAPLQLLEEIQNRQSDLLDPIKIQTRVADRSKKMKPLKSDAYENPSNSPVFWAYAFRLLGDPLSLKIARDIEARKFDLEVVDGKEITRRCREFEVEESETDNAVFLHSGITKGKPLMMVKDLPLDQYSYETRSDPIFVVMGKIVHEYQHFLDIDPTQVRSKAVVHLQEMRAHLQEALWRASYGDSWKLASFVRDGNSGFALHWRDKFESLYGIHFKRSGE